MKKVLASIILLISVCNLSADIIEAKQLFNKKIVNVKKEKVDRSKIYYARVSVDETKIVDVVTRYDGFIEKLYANKEYKLVKKDEKLAVIYSDEILNIKKELTLAKKIGDKALQNSATNKLKYLNVDGRSINDSEMVDLYSPAQGYIIKKDVLEGSSVKKGKTLFQIADFSKLWVIAKVYQSDVSFLSDGMDGVVKIDGIDGSFKAKLDFIYPKIDEKDQSIDVRLVVDNNDLRLYPNMFAKVKFISSSDDILTLPRSAVLTKGDKNYVFIPLDNNSYEPKEVKVKRLYNGKFEVISGLKENDKVIDKVLFMLDSDAVTNGLYDADDDNW